MIIGSIFDSKAGNYIQDCIYADLKEVMRNLTAIVNDSDPKNIFARYPSDFQLDLFLSYEDGNWTEWDGQHIFQFAFFKRGDSDGKVSL